LHGRFGEKISEEPFKKNAGALLIKHYVFQRIAVGDKYVSTALNDVLPE